MRPRTLSVEAAPANRDVPIFMAHGAQDPLIPLARGAEARDRLIAVGYGVEWHEYLMPLSVYAEEISSISRPGSGGDPRPTLRKAGRSARAIARCPNRF